MTKFQIGDKVALEGRVTGFNHGNTVVVTPTYGDHMLNLNEINLILIERAYVPEPGDVWLENNGQIRFRDEDGWWHTSIQLSNGYKTSVNDAIILAQLGDTKVIRNGKVIK